MVEHQAVAPGSTTWVGIRFDIDPEWYIYWPGQNETGTPTSVRPSGPASARFGEPQWPVPKRHVVNGDTLDHVFKGHATVLLPVEVDETAEPGTVLNLAFDLDWMVCREACIPGWSTVELRLPVGDGVRAAEPDVEKAFVEARAQLPREPAAEEPPFHATWAGNEVTVRARGAHRLAFYPDERSGRVAGILRSGESASDTLRMRVGPAGSAKPGAEPAPNTAPLLSGVIEVFSHDGRSRAFRVRSGPPGTGAGG
jgi:hypothetical protein